MRNEWTTLRIQHKEPGSNLDKKLAFGIPMVRRDASGRMVKDTANKWMHYVDYELELQFNEYKNIALAFGRSNRNSNGEYMNFGKSGMAIRMGSGIFEQAEVSNSIYYNSTNGIMKLILNGLYDLSAGKLEFKDRTFVINTGERGALLFNKEAKKTTSGWMPIVSTQNPPIYKTVQSDFSKAAISVTDYQVTEWIAPMGVRVILNVDPFYDDPVRNKLIHPEGGPAFSYRFDIWYIGTMDQPNIQKCAVRGKPEVRGYQWGLRNPFTGQYNNMNMSYDEDSAVIHKMATLGAMVLDPTRTLSIIPSMLKGYN